MKAENGTEPKLKRGRMMPLFALPSTAGGTTGPDAFRSKYNLVVVFVGEGQEAEEYLRAVAGIYPDLQDEHARVLAVTTLSLPQATAARERLSLLFPLLSDPDGQATARMLGDVRSCALCVPHRYGEAISV